VAVPGAVTERLTVRAARAVQLTVSTQACAVRLTVRADGLRTQRVTVPARRTVNRRLAAALRPGRRTLHVRAQPITRSCAGARVRMRVSLEARRPLRSTSPAAPAGGGETAAPPASSTPATAAVPPAPVPAPQPPVRPVPAVPDPPPPADSVGPDPVSPAAGPVFDTAALWVDPDNAAARTAAEWRGQGRASDADLLVRIARTPQATWFGDWNGTDPAGAVREVVQRAQTAGQVPFLVAYNIPSRDCGQFSAGGAPSADAYRQWLDGFARGIGDARAIVIVEPDALALTDCLPLADQGRAVELVRYAARTLSALPGVTGYLDAGHSGWHAPEAIAARLRDAGVELVRGFSLNISNFRLTADEVPYGERVSALLGGQPFVVDTSRNGAGPTAAAEWCNPPGRALGPSPTANTGSPAADAFLWIKRPGESDGTCNGGPSAGTWWPEEALALARRAATA
jgi:endoglucanase